MRMRPRKKVSDKDIKDINRRWHFDFEPAESIAASYGITPDYLTKFTGGTTPERRAALRKRKALEKVKKT